MPAEGTASGWLRLGTWRILSKSKLEAEPGDGCDGLVEAIETVVSVIPCERRKPTERRRKACWDLENFHKVPEPVGRRKTPEPVGRNTCYSTRIWAFSIVFELALRRDARPSADDDDRSRRAAIVWHIEKQPKSLRQQACHCGSSGAARDPRPVGRNTCVSTIVAGLWVRCQRSCQGATTCGPEQGRFYSVFGCDRKIASARLQQLFLDCSYGCLSATRSSTWCAARRSSRQTW